MRSFSRSSTAGSRYIWDGSVEARAVPVSSLAMREHCRSVAASLAIVNGQVWSRPGLSAVAVDGERITFVGAGSLQADRVIDAAGAAILPAFNDAHVHFLMGSRSLGELDLHGVATQAEIERRIVEYARGHAGQWLVGRGWFYSAFPGGMPTVGLLDRLVADRPAYIESFDAHTGWANSRALAIAGLSGGGVLKEAALLGVTRLIPRRTAAEDIDALRAGMTLAASRGIASVQEAGEGLEQMPLWKSLHDSGDLTLRVRLALDMTPGMEMHEWAKRLDLYEEARRDSDRRISPRILKAFADGGVESKTAAPLQPYPHFHERRDPLLGPGRRPEAGRLA